MNLNEYQTKVIDTWISNEHDLERIVFGICGESGEIAEYFKKFYRGDFVTPDYTLIRKELGDVLYYLAMLCNQLGMKLEDVMQVNLNKLDDRKKRNKLKGSGDKR